MDATALHLLRQLVAEVVSLRREVADQGLEILELLERLEQTRTAPSTDAASMLAAIFEHFGEVPFLCVELLDWCRPCVDQAQRDAYRGICALCADDDPTPLQAGKALRALVGAAPGQWRVKRCGERHKTALWGITPPSPQ
jgi:hypothetical protein